MTLYYIKRRLNTRTDIYGTLDSLVERDRIAATGVLTHTYIYVVRDLGSGAQCSFRSLRCYQYSTSAVVKRKIL